MFTPWGQSYDADEMMEGVFSVSTLSHGGIMIEKAVAAKLLTPFAIKRGVPYGNYLTYEEDCQISIPLYELTELHDRYFATTTDAVARLYRSLSNWNADYLIELGIEPSEAGLKFWKEFQARHKR